MPQSRRLFFLVCACLLSAGCAQDPELFTLGEWEFRPGPPAPPFDPPSAVWKPTSLPSYGKPIKGFENSRGWLVFRSRLPAEVATQQRANHLAVDAGMLSDVSRVYINDELVAAMGSADPYQTASMMNFTKTVPGTIRLKPDKNYLYLALYTDGNFPIFATEYPVIGKAETILRDYYKRELLSIALLGIYLLVGLYYLFLWSKRRKEIYHLYFGLLCVLLCAYWFFRLGSRDILFGNDALLRSKIEYSLLFFISPVFAFFLSHFFHDKYDKVGLILLPFCAAIALVTAFGSYRTATLCLSIWQLCIMPVIAYYIFYIFRELYRRNRSALYLLPGVATLMLGAVHDILAIRGWVSTPMIARFAFPVFILGGAMVLTRRFLMVHGQVEELLGNAYRLENFRTELLSIDPGASIDALLERILVVLKTLFDCEKAFAIVPDSFGALHFTQELPAEIRTLIFKGSRLHRRTKISAEFFENHGSVLDMAALKLRPSPIEGKQHLISLRATELVFQKVAELGYKLAIALPYEAEILGMIFLGKKSGEQEYTQAELSLVKTFQYSITQAIRNKMLFSEVSQLKGEAEERVERLSEYVIERRNSFQVKVDEKTIVYSSPSMVEVYEQAKKYADTNRPLLISGETGTGKELIARAVHHFGKPNSPFIAVNCATIPESLWESEVFGHARGAFTSAQAAHTGLIERAKDGTLFLDEIGEMPLSVQAKMLRLLGCETGVDESALSALCRYSWPGNVRELENCMIQAIVHCKGDKLQVEDLPPGIRAFTSSRLAPQEPGPLHFAASEPFDVLVADYSRRLILAAMSKASGNKLQASKLLGLKRTTFYNKLKELGLR